MPDQASLLTKIKQPRALKIVCNQAVKLWGDLLQSHNKINEYVLEIMKQNGRRGGNSNFLANDSTSQIPPPTQRPSPNSFLQYGPSLAKKTISSYKAPTDIIPTSRHHESGADHPYNATTDYLSRYPLGWAGCFACGDQGYTQSVKCLLWQAGRVNKKAFFLELHAHKPWTKRRGYNSERPQSYQPPHNDGPNAPPSN